MRNKFTQKKSCIFFISLLFLLITIFNFNVAFATDFGLYDTASSSGLVSPDSGNQEIVTIVGNIVGYALYFTGSIFFILIIIAGFTWMTAGGDEKKVKSAKDKIKGAMMGIIVIICAYVITNFVFDALQQTIEATPPTQQEEPTPPAP